jgi:hypothetical protein
MLADRFGLALSTPSAAARDAYVDASERARTFYPGALAAYDRAISADPNFAVAHAGKAQVLMREGNVAGALRPWSPPRNWLSGSPSVRQATSQFSTWVRADRPRRQSPRFINTSRRGRSTRW